MNAAKAQRELGVQFRPFDQTLADSVIWTRVCLARGRVQRPADDRRRLVPSSGG